jgi:DNA polymerase/3'-5' exonuclease PolX
MKLQETKQRAEGLLNFFKPYTDRIEIVGSIRRECPEVNDVDLILIPKSNFKEALDKLNDEPQYLKHTLKKKGEKMIVYELDELQYDLYICTEQNWEVIKLIRTGSKEHNKKLCLLAIKKGMSLKAGGEGLVKDGIVISNTEEGILKELLGKYIEPKDRI